VTGRGGWVARVVVGAMLALGFMAAVGAFTRFAYSPDRDADAELRLAWRARVPLIEECRRLSDAEQAELPVHMRREVVCEGRVASYALTVTVDGETRHRATASGAGARGDRPIYVFETIDLEPGIREVVVSFVRIGAGDQDGGGEQRAATGVETIPERLVLRRALEVAAGDVVLVTYDPSAGELVIR
jgi:hypothetical protein